MPAPDAPPLTPDTPLAEVLQSYPGARRSLFAKYHIGGCSACAFSPTETLAQLCARNEAIPVEELIEHIRSSHDEDVKLQITPQELAELKAQTPGLRLLDARTREEHEAVHIPGSVLISQELIQEAFAAWDKNAPVVIYDHTGGRSLDIVAYFIGHGFDNARCLAGGIDAYSSEVDPTLPRYRVEIED
jgi:rhodanese-related sulfurtransferase